MALPRCIAARFATAWDESLEGAFRGHDTWATLCRFRSRLLLAEIPKGADRNTELRRRLRMWEEGHIKELVTRILGQQNYSSLRLAGRPQQPQTDEQRGKRACTLTVRRSISKAVKGLVGGAARGSPECRKLWTISLIPRSTGNGTHLTQEEGTHAAHLT